MLSLNRFTHIYTQDKYDKPLISATDQMREEAKVLYDKITNLGLSIYSVGIRSLDWQDYDDGLHDGPKIYNIHMNEMQDIIECPEDWVLAMSKGHIYFYLLFDFNKKHNKYIAINVYYE